MLRSQLRCPRGRLQLAHAAAKSVDACADHARAETLLALLTALVPLLLTRHGGGQRAAARCTSSEETQER